MPWCPNCRSEYCDGFAACADCGAQLVDELPEVVEQVPQSEPEEPVYLTTITDERELELFTQLLHASKIPFFTKDQELGDYMRIYMGFSVFGQDVYVRQRDLAICSHLLAQSAGEYADDEMQAAYDDYMANAEAEAMPQEESNGNYRIFVGFLIFFGAIVGLYVLLQLLNAIFIWW